MKIMKKIMGFMREYIKIKIRDLISYVLVEWVLRLVYVGLSFFEWF